MRNLVPALWIALAVAIGVAVAPYLGWLALAMGVLLAGGAAFVALAVVLALIGRVLGWLTGLARTPRGAEPPLPGQ